jgi:hypothetical protein
MHHFDLLERRTARDLAHVRLVKESMGFLAEELDDELSAVVAADIDTCGKFTASVRSASRARRGVFLTLLGSCVFVLAEMVLDGPSSRFHGSERFAVMAFVAGLGWWVWRHKRNQEDRVARFADHEVNIATADELKETLATTKGTVTDLHRQHLKLEARVAAVRRFVARQRARMAAHLVAQYQHALQVVDPVFGKSAGDERVFCSRDSEPPGHRVAASPHRSTAPPCQFAALGALAAVA